VLLIPKFSTAQNDNDKTEEMALCDALKVSQPEMRVDISDAMSYDDGIRLMAWRLKYNLKSGKQNIDYGAETNWKRAILDIIFNIIKAACPEYVVPHGLLEILKEFNLIYQNSVINKTDNSEEWKNHVGHLQACEKDVEMLWLGGVGHSFEYWMPEGPTPETDSYIPIETPREDMDDSPHLDPIIDTLWWVFSGAMGQCHKKSNPGNEMWGMAIKSLFQQDFLDQLSDRWAHSGDGVDFGYMVGDFPFDRSLRNLRSCVSAIYSRHDLGDKQPPRPISAMAPSGRAWLNKKTGDFLPPVDK